MSINKLFSCLDRDSSSLNTVRTDPIGPANGKIASDSIASGQYPNGQNSSLSRGCQYPAGEQYPTQAQVYRLQRILCLFYTHEIVWEQKTSVHRSTPTF